MSPDIRVAVLSDVGCVRSNNEDNFGYDPANGLYIVCDGMGGMAAGEVASSIACSTCISAFAAQAPETPMDVRLANAIRAANESVIRSGDVPERKGMGTTLVAAAVRNNELLVANVGDSRAYLLKAGACMQLTVDHSYVNELIRMGSLKLEDVGHVDLNGMDSVITRAVGTVEDVEPDFFFVDMSDRDIILLASDGLTRYLDGPAISALVSADDLDQSCVRLVAAAKQMGGSDNITCLLLQYLSTKQEIPTSPKS